MLVEVVLLLERMLALMAYPSLVRSSFLNFHSIIFFLLFAIIKIIYLTFVMMIDFLQFNSFLNNRIYVRLVQTNLGGFLNRIRCLLS